MEVFLSMRKQYATDVGDKEWERIKEYFPEPAQGGNRKYTVREIVNAIFYIVRAGCGWRLLPHDFPHWNTVYYYFRKWIANGAWKKANKELREELRKMLGKNEEPTACVIDSQSNKTTEKGGSVGMMEGKK